MPEYLYWWAVGTIIAFILSLIAVQLLSRRP